MSSLLFGPYGVANWRTPLTDFERKAGVVEPEHFPECYITQYPDDEGVYCTCLDWSPEQ